MGELAKAIISTLVYFDIFDYPLTLDELHLYLLKYRATKEEIEKEIDKLKNFIDFKDGHYFLKGRDEILEIHKERQKISEKRWRKVKKVFYWLLQNIPFIKMAAISPSLAINNSQEESDIDLFVITEKNRLYTTRLFSFLLLKLFKLEINKKGSNRFHLNFYLTEDRLFIYDISLKPHDIYFYYWIVQILPLIDDNIFIKFIESNNWIFEIFPNIAPDLRNKLFHCKIKENSLFRLFKKIIERFLRNKIGDKLEQLFAKMQINYLWKSFPNHWPTASIIVKKNILKIHAIDRRREFQEKFEQKLKELLEK